eukprot:3496754-Rhodomonas_salina.1
MHPSERRKQEHDESQAVKKFRERRETGGGMQTTAGNVRLKRYEREERRGRAVQAPVPPRKVSPDPAGVRLGAAGAALRSPTLCTMVGRISACALIIRWSVLI